MEHSGKILGFAAYTPAQLEKMKEDLAFKMPLSYLQYCAAYYKNVGQRDPLIEELALLDEFCMGENAPRATAPIELLTNDAAAAETYADLMEKRRALRPYAKYPCTLTEAFALATDYLQYAGAEKELPNTALLLESEQKNAAAAAEDNCLFSPDGHTCLRFLQSDPIPAAVGDLLVLLLPSPVGNEVKQSAALGRLLNTPEFTVGIKKAYRVSENGLLNTLLGISDGLWIDYQRLSRTGEAVTLPMLTTAYIGDCLVRIDKSRWEALDRIARSCGVRAQVFASVTEGSLYTFVRPDRSQFTWESEFLRALRLISPLSAELGEEAETPTASVLQKPYSPKERSYVASPSKTIAKETALCAELTVAAATAAPQEAIFRNTIDAMLAPIMTLAASGGDDTKTRFAVSLALPEAHAEPHTFGACVSALLGIHRVQAELAMPTAASKLTFEKALTSPRISVFALDKSATETPAEWTAAGNLLYCVRVARRADGLPIFQALLGQLREISQLRKDGILKSAVLLSRTALTELAAAQDSRTLTAALTPSAASAEAETLAWLIETDQRIDCGELVGKLKERAEPLTLPPLPNALPPRTANLIWAPAREIVLVAKENDSAAMRLSALLTQKGANASLFSDGADTADRLSRALLTAHTLILCGRVRLKKTERMDFALETFSKAGGQTLTVGGAAPCAISPIFAFPNGIPEAILEQICKSEADL